MFISGYEFGSGQRFHLFIRYLSAIKAMNGTNRIIVNIIATYGCSIFNVLCGIFTVRWTLQALGQANYGIYSLIAGMISCITYVNMVLGIASSRFYSLSVGKESLDEKMGLQECRKWFNVALLIHSMAAIILVMIGYPIGIYAIRHWLVIPSERIEDSIWIFRFVCIAGLVGMIAVPFESMYTAKQRIAEKTIYTIISMSIKLGFIYYMVRHPGDWLRAYSFVVLLIASTMQILISTKAFSRFPECKIDISYMFDLNRVKSLFSFASWNLLGCSSFMIRNQGNTFIINQFMGPKANASYALATTVSENITSLANSLIVAFSPAVTNLWGGEKRERAIELSYRASKFSVILILLFMLPFLLEIEYVLKLWLQQPPQYCYIFCYAILLMTLADKMTTGQMMLIGANGKIAKYQATLSLISLFVLPVCVLLFFIGFSVYSISLSLFIIGLSISVVRLVFAKRIFDMSILYYLSKVVLPILTLAATSYLAGFTVVCMMKASFIRLLIVTAVSEVVMLGGVLKFILSCEEREYVLQKIKSLVCKLNFL